MYIIFPAFVDSLRCWNKVNAANEAMTCGPLCLSIKCNIWSVGRIVAILFKVYEHTYKIHLSRQRYVFAQLHIG
jgi:hypothetical protein